MLQHANIDCIFLIFFIIVSVYNLNSNFINGLIVNIFNIVSEYNINSSYIYH